MFLLDTDILTLLMRGHNKVGRRFEQANSIAIPILSRIQVLTGRFASVVKAVDGSQVLLAQHWLNRDEVFMSQMEVVPFSESAAKEFDQLLTIKKLRKIGRADLLIASIALARSAVLVTRNTKHFQQVQGLRIENWAD